MFCPECGQEYREDVTRCAECGATLTVDPPVVPLSPEPEWLDLETVLETGDPALLAVARSLLQAEGIICFARGDLLQEIVGWGRLAAGSNLATGPVQLQVARDRADEARALLAAADVFPPEFPGDGSTEG